VLITERISNPSRHDIHLLQIAVRFENCTFFYFWCDVKREDELYRARVNSCETSATVSRLTPGNYEDSKSQRCQHWGPSQNVRHSRHRPQSVLSGSLGRSREISPGADINSPGIKRNLPRQTTNLNITLDVSMTEPAPKRTLRTSRSTDAKSSETPKQHFSRFSPRYVS
jgi:hypothetical protein